MGWPFFSKLRKRAPVDDNAAAAGWWRDADAAAGAPSRDAVDRLVQAAAGEAMPPDEAERQAEMLDGLERLLTISLAQDVPVVATQHRVIGDEACHLVAPASIGADAGGSGKVFVTPTRVLVLGGPSVSSRPWHRVTGVQRTGRDVVLTGRGAGDALHIRCNTYGDAMALAHIIGRLRDRR